MKCARVAGGLEVDAVGDWCAGDLGGGVFGYAAWGWLLARHPAATITPMALLVPVFGMGGAALWLDESLPPWKLIAAALVMAGLALNLLWPRLRAVLAGRH